MISYQKLINLLADLYGTQGQSRRVVEGAEIPPGFIEFKDNARENWHNIVNEAKKRNKITDMVSFVCEEYPERKQELKEAANLPSIARTVDPTPQPEISAIPASQVETRDSSSDSHQQNLPAANAPTYKYDVFLSYNSQDRPLIEAVARRLEDEEGLNPFFDKWHLIPGEPVQEALEKALDSSETCAVFVGPNGLGPWENVELRSMLDDRVRNDSIRIIAVLLPGAQPLDKNTLPRFLRLFGWVDFRSGLDDPEGFRRLIAGIRGEAPGR